MIEWLERVRADRLFLRAREGLWTYGETRAEVRRRMVGFPRLIRPSLSPESVFDLLAAMAGGGATVVGPDPETTVATEDELVVFTSGTTGSPKGVRLTEDNLTAAAAGSARHLGHGADDDWLLAMPLHHVGGISVLVRQLYSGGSVTMLPAFDAGEFSSALHETATMASVVPAMLARLLDLGPYQGLRAVLVGGGPIPQGLLEGAREVGLPVLPTYGLTETFGQVATLRPDAPLAYEVHPLPGVEIRIESDQRIAIRGPQVSPGYVGEEDRPDPWFVTSDLGEIGPHGGLRVLGRADTVIITGGENVSPERVEAVLRQHPTVVDVVVVGVPDPEWGQLVACVYEGDGEGLIDWARGRLPGFMVPRRWERVEMIPRTSIGKPDRDAVVRSLGSSGRISRTDR